MTSSVRTIVGLALTALQGANAFFRINCATVQSGRIDPLVNPGTLAAHSHTILGGSNIGVNATYQSLLDSDCSSCEVQADKSAYWSPTLYYEYPNGSFIETAHGGGVVYYLGRGPGQNDTVPFPPGFMVLSGDKAARSYDNATFTYGTADYPGRPVADRISFACLDGLYQPEQPYMYKTDCQDGMRAQVHFQSCWNGKDLYKPDNSHVAYQSRIDDGICPPTHPVQIPHIFLEINYQVNDIPEKTPDGRFVFSQGDPTGYGFHADFQNGWEMDIQTYAVKNCLNTVDFGQISACPPLQAVDTSAYGVNCPQRPRPIDEPVDGLLAKLPGCITITPGPAAAPAASMTCPKDVIPSRIIATKDTTATPTQSVAPGQTFGSEYQIYLGCFNDTAGQTRALNAYSEANYVNMTVENCMGVCHDRGYRLSGVEYAQECHCGNVLNPTAVGGQLGCNWNCGRTMVESLGYRQNCGGYSLIDLYNNTDPAFVANGSETANGGLPVPYTPLAPFADNYVGCYTDLDPRTLNSNNTQSDDMSVEVCAAFCAGGPGYRYYGVEYGSQCYCGNAFASVAQLLNTTSSPTNDSACSIRCAGSNPELCGGANALSIYNVTDFVVPAPKPFVGKYRSQGCLSDPPNNIGRSLTGPSTDSPNMTNELCIKYCLGQEMHYAAIEYITQCFCGNAVNSAGGAQTLSCPVSNLMTCPGNKEELCGGPNLMNLFYSSTL
ncbi:hypothetical protein LTR95_004311 [Oleoguttula sp. CCFEE 5521]